MAKTPSSHPVARPTFKLPSYRLHKPSGQAVVTLRGRDIYLGKFDTPESRAAYDVSFESTRYRAAWQVMRQPI